MVSTSSSDITIPNTQDIRVTSTITSISGSNTAANLGEIDITNVGDGYIFVFNATTQKYEFQDPDRMLSKSVEDNTLPSSFINKLDDELNNRVDADGGVF